MLQRTIGFTLLAMMLTVAAAPLAAAHDEFRIIGIVTKISATEIAVKQKDGKIVEMDMNRQTKFTRDKKPVTLKDVKVGGSVVVDALGDSVLDLTVLEVRLVPAITPAK
ncbi:MAG: hypothetical protein Q8O42_06620 [Acidobacteriota bacterium]|nr:hypothetical protein [Acidobacteriota bacterium]